MQTCWNCFQTCPGGDVLCMCCSHKLKLGREEASRMLLSVSYLETELERWGKAGPVTDSSLQILLEDIRGRRSRLQLLISDTNPAPVGALGKDHPISPPCREPLSEAEELQNSPVRTPVREKQFTGDGATSSGDTLEKAQDPQISAPDSGRLPRNTWYRILASFLEERNIHWFLSLGAVLALAGVLAFIRYTWSGAGRYVLESLLMATALGFIYLGDRLRGRLEKSSRILLILGAILVPVVFIAANRFELLGARLPWALWLSLTFSISTPLYVFMILRYQEVPYLYMGVTSFALLALNAAAALTAPAPTGGVLIVLTGLACIVVAASLRKKGELLYSRHLYTLGQCATIVTLVGAFPDPIIHGESGFLEAAIICISAGVVYASNARLLGGAGSLALSACLFGIGGCLWLLWAHRPGTDYTFYFLGLGWAYLAMAGFTPRSLPQETGEGIRQRSLREAALITGFLVTTFAFAAGFAQTFPAGMWNNFAAMPRWDLIMTLAAEILVTVAYVLSAVFFSRPVLMYPAALAACYSWFLGVVLLHSGQPVMYPIDLLLFSVAAVIGAWALRGIVPAAFIQPVLDVCQLLGLVPGFLAVGFHHFGPGSYSIHHLVTLLLLGLFYVLAACVTRRAASLYFAVSSFCLCYGYSWKWLGAHFPGIAGERNLGLEFLPLLPLLVMASRKGERTWGREYSLPVYRLSLLLSIFLILLQIWQWAVRPDWTVPAALLLYGTGFAVAFRVFKDDSLLGVPVKEVLTTVGAACFGAAGLALSCLPRNPGGDFWLLAVCGLMTLLYLLPSFRDSAWKVPMTFFGLFFLLPPLIGYGGTVDPAPRTLAIAVVPVLYAITGVGQGQRSLMFCAPILALWSLHVLNAAPEAVGTLADWTKVALCAAISGTSFLFASRHGDKAVTVIALLAAATALASALGNLELLGRYYCEAFWIFNGMAALIGRELKARESRASYSVFYQVAEGLAWLTMGISLFSDGLLLGARNWIAYGFAFGGIGWVGRDRRLLGLGAPCLTVGASLLILHFSHSAVFLLTSLGAASLLWIWVHSLLLPGRDAGFLDPIRTLALGLAVITAVIGAFALLDRNLLGGYSPGSLGPTVPALLLSGLTFLSSVLRLRQDLFWHAGAVCIGLAMGEVLRHAGITDPDILALPVGAYLFLWDWIYRIRGNSGVAGALETWGLLVVMFPAFLQSFGRLHHAFLLGGEAVAAIVAGTALRHRAPLILGSAFLLIEVVIQHLSFLASLHWPVYLLGLGLIFLAIGLFGEQKREEILRAGRQLMDTLNSWE